MQVSALGKQIKVTLAVAMMDWIHKKHSFNNSTERKNVVRFALSSYLG